MNPTATSNSSRSATTAESGSQATTARIPPCVFGRHALGPSIFVTEDGEEKPACVDHFLALQQAELLAEVRKRRMEKIKSEKVEPNNGK